MTEPRTPSAPVPGFPEGGVCAEIRDMLRKVQAGEVTPEVATNAIAQWMVTAVRVLSRNPDSRIKVAFDEIGIVIAGVELTPGLDGAYGLGFRDGARASIRAVAALRTNYLGKDPSDG